MTDIEKIDACVKAAKTLQASLKKRERLSEKPFSPKVSADQNWLAMAIGKERHELHRMVVRAWQ